MLHMGTEKPFVLRAEYLCTHTGHKLKCFALKSLSRKGFHFSAQQSKSEAGKVLLLIMRKIILMSKFNSRLFECSRKERNIPGYIGKRAIAGDGREKCLWNKN